MKRQHGNLEFKCEFCDFKTTFKHTLQFHINSQHTQQVKFQCAICDHFTYQKSRLASHIKNVHNNSDLDKKFQCEQCPFKANIKRKLQDHTMRIHTTKNPYKCDLCDYRAKISIDVQTHKRKHHNKDTIKLKCFEWLWIFVAWQYYKTFQKSTWKYKSIRMWSMWSSIYSKNCIQRHQYTVHGMKNLPLFKCSKCEFETINRVVLKNHIIGNHETIPKKCELCQKVLKNIICFRNHMRIVHSENKKVYKCEVCPKQYDKLKK